MNEERLRQLLWSLGVNVEITNYQNSKLYINLASKNKKCKGDREHILYFDLQLNRLVSHSKSNNYSIDFSNDLKAIEHYFSKTYR